MNIFNNLHFPAFFYKWKNIKKWLVSNGLRYHFFSFPVLCLPILFHIARHTFATTTTLAKGVPIETVSKMLGHTNIETTQIYARITNNKISNDMQGLDKKFVGIEKI
ncbi:tyrosine-type recombinase/integrase, partial [Bacteroides fragilis]